MGDTGVWAPGLGHELESTVTETKGSIQKCHLRLSSDPQKKIMTSNAEIIRAQKKKNN